MSRRNEHILAIILEPYEIGQKFEKWPLHITIVPWFPADDTAGLDKLLTALAAKQRPFSVRIGDVEYFGVKKDVAVNIVEPTEPLTKLHEQTVTLLDTADMSVHQRDFIGPNYRAHITCQEHAKARKGQEFMVSEFVLVQQDRLKKSGRMIKSIKKAYELG